MSHAPAGFKFRTDHVVSPHLSRDGKAEYAVVDRDTGEDVAHVWRYITDTHAGWFAKAADGRRVNAEVVAGRWGEPFLSDGASGLTFATRKDAAETVVRLIEEETA